MGGSVRRPADTCPAARRGRCGSADGVGRMRGEQAGAWSGSSTASARHALAAEPGQLLVRLVTHELAQLGRVRDVHRFAPDVGLGVAGAVPVEVVAAGTPTTTVVLADRDDEHLRTVGAGDVVVRPSDRQLPADVGLRLERVHAFAERERVQRTPGPAREPRAVEEDARAVDDAGLARTLVVDLDELLRPVQLPRLGSELPSELQRALLVL